MAVVAPPPIQNKLDIWGTVNPRTSRREASEPMTSIMSYQYPPPPPPNGAEMDMPPSGYMPSYSMPPSASGIDMRSTQESSMERKDSLSQSSSEHAMGLSGEKRRNKLGYHRTSVACGHCRRRKIRCIPSPADVQGRCVNCIRLKKECSFYPVDQQPPTDTRSKASSRASTGPKIASASSSPAIPSGHPTEMPPHQQYPPLAMPPMAPPAMKPPGTDTFSPDSKMPSSASSSGRPFDFPGQPMTNWMAPDQSPSSATKPNDLHASWRTYPHESPITPSFSPYTPHAPPSAGWNAPVSAESAPREDVSWSNYPPPPPRSMSFGGEGMNSHPGGQYPPMSHRPYERKSASIPSEMYPPPIATSVSGVESTPATMDHNVSLSAGAVPPSSYGNWQQQPYQYSKPGEPYGNWGYGENGSNAPVQGGDQVPHPPESQQQPADMYYPPR